jgi:hypothetical protein
MAEAGPRGEGGRETRYVHFKWRWQPNEVGAAFDRSNPASGRLPKEARRSPLAARDSAREYDGIARFDRAGDGWELAEVFCNVLYDEYLRKNIPLADAEWP